MKYYIVFKDENRKSVMVENVKYIQFTGLSFHFRKLDNETSERFLLEEVEEFGSIE